MIDLQSFDGMTPQDASAYAAAMGQTLTSLREKNIPVVWVTVDATGKGNKAWLPGSGAGSSARSEAELSAMGFSGSETHQGNHEIFSRFMQEHGPRNNEPVFRKSFMDAFAEPTDINHPEGEAHKKALLVQAGAVYENEKTFYSYPESFRRIPEAKADDGFKKLFGTDITVADYMRKTGVTDTLIMGQVSHYCVLETAVGAASKGFNPVIAGDRTLSWVYTTDPATKAEQATFVWQGTRDLEGNPLNETPGHEERMQAQLNQIIAIEASERGLTSQALQEVKDIKIMDAIDVLELMGNGPTKSMQNNNITQTALTAFVLSP